MRREAVARLEDHGLVANRARWDDDPRVRQTAAARLDDGTLLSQIRDGDDDAAVRAAAGKRLDELAAAAHETAPEV